MLLYFNKIVLNRIGKERMKNNSYVLKLLVSFSGIEVKVGLLEKII